MKRRPKAKAQPSKGPAGDVLVCLFLRGGADGLHLVAPYGDEGYYAGRPRIAVPRPDDTRVECLTRCFTIFFGAASATEAAANATSRAARSSLKLRIMTLR